MCLSAFKVWTLKPSVFLIIFLLSLDILETERPVTRPHTLILNINVCSHWNADEVLAYVQRVGDFLALNSLVGQQNNTFTPKIMWYARFGISYILRVRHCYAKNNFVTFYKCHLPFSHSHFHSICCWKISLYLCKDPNVFLHNHCCQGINALGLFQSPSYYLLLFLEKRGCVCECFSDMGWGDELDYWGEKN